MIDAKKVKSRMRELKLQSKDLAQKVHVSPAMMCYILQGVRTPSLTTTANIAEVLGMKIDEIVKH